MSWDLKSSGGSSPGAAASRGGCPWGGLSQPQERKFSEMRRQGKEQTLFGEWGKGFFGISCILVGTFLVDRCSKVSHTWRYLINCYLIMISSANSRD